LALKIRFLSILVCLGAIWCSCLLASTSAQLSGTVRASGAAVADARVVVTAFEAPIAVFETSTGEDGSWTIEVPLDGLASRSVYLEAGSSEHAPSRFGGAPDLAAFFGYPGTGAQILEPGDVLTGLDIELAVGGRLSGSVRARIDSSAVPGASVRPALAVDGQVRVFSSQFHAVVGADGLWQSPLTLPPGEYRLVTWPPSGANLVVTAYDQINCQHQSCDLLATDGLTLLPGQTITHIDVLLATGARLSGEVLPTGISRSLRLYDASGSRVSSRTIFGSGSAWTFDGLAGGSYYLEIRPLSGSSSFLVPQLHNGHPCPGVLCDRAGGPPLTVAAAGNRSGINIVLSEGGRVSGTLVDADSGLAPAVSAGATPLIGEYMLLDAAEAVVGTGPILDDGGTIRLGPSSAVPAGSYRLATFDRGMGAGPGYDQPGFFLDFSTLPGYADALYPSAGCAGLVCDEAAALPINVTTGSVVSALEVGVRRGSSVRGRILDDDSGLGIAGAVAVLVDRDNRRYAAVRTNAEGDFAFGGFPAGTYYLRTAMSSNFGQNAFPDRHAYFDRVLGSPGVCTELLCDPLSGTPLLLDGASDVAGLELRVQAGPVIRGFVIDPLTRAAIGRGAVEVYDSADRLVGRYLIDGLDRQYQTTALASGTYRLVAALPATFAPLSLPSGSIAGRAQGSDPVPGVQFVQVGQSDVSADFLAVDRAIDEVFSNRFQVD
jgi:hypothetical protein